MKNKYTKKQSIVPLNKRDSNYDFIIVGAGISGLYTCYNLLKINKNYKILILEKNKENGGRIQTINYKKTTYEAGGARFHDKQLRISKLIRELKLDKLKYKISNDTIFLPYPINKYEDVPYLNEMVTTIKNTNNHLTKFTHENGFIFTD